MRTFVLLALAEAAPLAAEPMRPPEEVPLARLIENVELRPLLHRE
jgi:hypothetical protein